MLSCKNMSFWGTCHQSVRTLTKKNLTLYQNSPSVKKKKLLLKAMQDKKVGQKNKKTIKRKLADDIESLWFDSLSSDNLKLYRKTSFGSFRKVNNDKLIEKLRAIYPSKVGSLCGLDKDNSRSSPEKKTSEVCSSSEDLASPYVSDFLIQNMMNFPLLKTHCDNTFKACLKEERDDFGVVDSIKYPSVTKILTETASEASKMRLQKWRTEMIEKLGEEGFFKYHKDLLARGAQFHGFLRRYLQDEDDTPVELDPAIEGCWKSLNKVLPAISKVELVEEAVSHPVLMYRGIVDCVASYRDVPSVIEWKKSDKPKWALKDTYDAPLQLCAYLGALGWRSSVALPPIKQGLVVVAYTSGAPANVFSMDLECCQVYWMSWLRRLQTYWMSRSQTVLEQTSDA